VHDPILRVGDHVPARVVRYLRIKKPIRHASLPLARLALCHARCLGGSIPFVDFRGKISWFGRGVQTSAALRTDFGHPPLPSFVVLAIKFQPALLTCDGWNSILTWFLSSAVRLSRVSNSKVSSICRAAELDRQIARPPRIREGKNPAKRNETGFNAGHGFGTPESRSRRPVPR
jgi:hypothetical protein